MANYYYVDNDGTATGDAGRFTSKQTGSFTALGVGSAYVSITAALAATTVPAAGDFIVCSEFYAFDNVSSALARTYPSTGQGVVCMSVDDTAIDSYKAGAKEETNSGITFTGKVSFMGFTLDTSVAIAVTANSSGVFKDCVLVLTSSSDYVGSISDGGYMLLLGCEISCAHTSNALRIMGGARVDMFGGSFTAATTANNLLDASTAQAGGATLNVSGADLSVIDGTLVNAGDAQTFDDILEVRIEGCKLNSAVAFSIGFANLGSTIEVTRSTDVSADADWQYYKEVYAGTIEAGSSIYRDEDEAFTESNQRVSYEIISNADCGIATPLVFDFPVLRYAELSAGATDTLRFYLTSATALTDSDVYVEVTYPDGTNKQTFNLATSQNSDYFATGTTLTTDSSSTWTGGLTNKYQIDVSTAGDAGADCQPIVKVFVHVPSVTVHIASEFGMN